MLRGRLFAGLLATVIIVGTTGIILILIFTKVDINEVLLEIVKAFLNIIVVGVIGNLIAVLVKNYQRYQEKIDKERDVRRGVIDRLDQAYRDVKGVRRTLKANALRSESTTEMNVVNIEVYSTQMKELEDTQLDLEDMVKEIDLLKSVFLNYAAIKSDIASMESFLRKVTREYETMLPRVLSNEQVLQLDRLEYLQDIVGPYRSSQMRIEFMQKYQSARSLILRDFLSQ